MRKTQVALAALALVASTAALADVTVYGNVDAGIASTKGKTQLYGDGNNATTLFGIKGSEDLGGGLKAGFNLESGLDVANGKTNGPNGGGNTNFFNRAANVSLSTESVGLTLGNQFSNVVLAALVNGATGVGGDGANIPAVVRLFGGVPGYIAQTGSSLATTTTNTNVFFIPQALQLSFNGGGISANVMHRVVDKGTTDGTYTGATVSTSMGGINIGAGYQTAGFNTSTNDYNSTFIAANTSFGGVRINGAYSNNGGKNTTSKSNGYMVGVSSPITGALSGGLTYASGTDAHGTALIGSLEYPLSKATMTYLNYAQFSKDGGGTAIAGAATGNTGVSITGKSLLTVGLRHSF